MARVTGLKRAFRSAADTRRGGRRCAAAAAVASVLAACATTQAMPDDYGWFYRAGYGTAADDDRPIGIYGPPESSALYVFECYRVERVVAIISIDVEPFDGERPLGLRVGRARWSGHELMDPPDGQAMSRALVPLEHPVMDEIAAGRGPIRIFHPEGIAPLPGGEVPARVIRECRTTAGR